MQRPRFKRHWDDRKWQNPINSMTESVKSNMFSSASFLSSPGLSFLRFLFSVPPLLPLSSLLWNRMCCVSISLYLSSFLKLCFCLCVPMFCLFFYLSISSPLPLSWIVSLFVLCFSLWSLSQHPVLHHQAQGQLHPAGHKTIELLSSQAHYFVTILVYIYIYTLPIYLYHCSMFIFILLFTSC